jgi:hypothetical protein
MNILSGIPGLAELNLSDNPCTQRFSYKYDIL